MKYINKDTKELVIPEKDIQTLYEAALILGDLGKDLCSARAILCCEFPEYYASGCDIYRFGHTLLAISENKKLSVKEK